MSNLENKPDPGPWERRMCWIILHSAVPNLDESLYPENDLVDLFTRYYRWLIGSGNHPSPFHPLLLFLFGFLQQLTQDDQRSLILRVVEIDIFNFFRKQSLCCKFPQIVGRPSPWWLELTFVVGHAGTTNPTRRLLLSISSG
jgi:hypothetical protein